MNRNRIYWNSGIIAVDCMRLARLNGAIVQADLKEEQLNLCQEVRVRIKRDNLILPILTVTVKRDRDSLEHDLSFCYPIHIITGNEEDGILTREKLLAPVEELYQGFGVSQHSQLVGKLVEGFYDTSSTPNSLCGIRRK